MYLIYICIHVWDMYDIFLYDIHGIWDMYDTFVYIYNIYMHVYIYIYIYIHTYLYRIYILIQRDKIKEFGLASLLNGISTFVDYFMPKLSS